jgi:hypothetical protein
LLTELLERRTLRETTRGNGHDDLLRISPASARRAERRSQIVIEV